MNFLDIRTDFAFKKVFGSEGSKDILLSFLNAVLPFDDGKRITDLTIVDPYNIPMLKGMKDTFVDVKALLSDGTRVIIEMQILNHDGFEKRVLYNAAKNYSAQLVQGQAYHLLNPVIALTLTDFVMFPDSPRLMNCFKLLEKRDFIEYCDDIELVFIELPKFNKTETELETERDNWLYFIKNAAKLNDIPKNCGRDLAKAFGIANEANLSPEELELQHRKSEFIVIVQASLDMAIRQGKQEGIELGIELGKQEGIEQGKQEGIEQGKQEGIAESRRATVFSAHQAGVPVATIAQIVQMDSADVIALLASAMPN
ncbi:Rpn family recombination-promoting nuclease/putative transposase [Methylovulum psychrotolerans]|uniref:Rpn family recombination-promoting nuclease/putative transposase n=1 Tax=Methylovulum psychrotolerans TaxID=1704499 RepID=UPI001BFF2FCC|nr:Rpn family recombination-promoting nuclease/putative transposase [Methylovulum psychrotolerans]MBT9096557.1 Rpn family recombination-promoting nuclease/putative transposase [Methylovulum psychrotolerans]